MTDAAGALPVSVKSLSCCYEPTRPVLCNVSFTLGAGEIITLLGINGAGKSTLMKSIARLIPKNSGEVFVFGRQIESYSIKEYSRVVSYVGQNDADCRLSLLEYILMGRKPYLGITAKASNADRELCEEYIRRADLLRYRDTPVSSLSGGERKRARLARALVKDAPVLLLDEPIAALDLNHERDMLRLIRSLALEGKSVIMSTHNPSHTFLLKSKVLILQPDGSSLEGTYDSPEILAAIRDTYAKSVVIKEDERGFACLPRGLEEDEDFI